MIFSWRAGQVAKDAGYIALSRACGDTALITSYAMLNCEELYGYQGWHGSQLTPVQREFPNEYPPHEFKFWVMYGSWS